MQSEMTPSLMHRIRGFIAQFAGQCIGCAYKSAYNCSNCDTVNVARVLLMEIDGLTSMREQKFYIENVMDGRFLRIVKAIRQAGRPLQSSEIRLDGVTRALKGYVLKQMCRKGILSSRVNDSGHYEFYLNEHSRELERVNKRNFASAKNKQQKQN